MRHFIWRASVLEYESVKVNKLFVYIYYVSRLSQCLKCLLLFDIVRDEKIKRQDIVDIIDFHLQREHHIAQLVA